MNKTYKAKRQDSAGRIQQKVNPDQEIQGVPQEGAAGVTESVESIMERQKEIGNKPPVERMMPEREGPERDHLPQNPESPATSSSATTPDVKPAPTVKKSAAFRPTAPQTTGTNFLGATLADTGAFPPDTMGAVGPTQFVVFVNGRVRTFNKTTGVADGVVNADADVFFTSVLTPVPAGGVNFTSDPNVRYDRLSARWFLTIIDVPSSSSSSIGDTPNRLLIAVSDAASAGVLSASTVWTFYFVQQDTVGLATSSGEFLDYPSLGIDANALYVGGNMFGAVSGSFVGTNAYVIRKSSVLSGGPVVTTAFRALTNGSTEGPFAPRGVDNYDPAATEGYFIGVSILAFGRLVMRRVSTPGGTPTISANILITVASTSNPRTVDHLGNALATAGRLDALDDRLYAAHIRNGRLWTAHNISVDTTGVGVSTGAQRRDGSRWYELIVPPTTGTPTVNQFGTIFDTAALRANSREYWIPSAMVSGQGHAAFGYSTAGTTFPINAATNGRLATDTLGTSQAVAIYTNNTTNSYNPPSDTGGTSGRRWGDYSFTSLDPKDDMTLWTIQEYCNATNSYGVQAVQLKAPPPATPSSAGAGVLPGKTNVNVVITGTVVNGSGFYDPGANLPAPALPFNHISATVTGGVTVNSVSYLDPTHVTLNVTTTGATAGLKDVTITNPDGQSMTGTGVLNVVSAESIIISEFRTRGVSGPSNGAADEFVELYNTNDVPVDIINSTLVEDAGNVRYTVPVSTMVPARGHYLIAGTSYSLGANASADGTLTAAIGESGIALFLNNTAPFAANTKQDAVGFTPASTLYREGAGLFAPSGATACECSYVRKASTTNGFPQDTNDNVSDFVFVATDGAVHDGRQSTLGAPGPENFSSPVTKTNAQVTPSLISPMNAGTASPNRVRDYTPYDNPAGPPVEYPAGTLSIQRRFTNPAGSGVTITRLRFRVIDITTLGSPGSGAGQADLRVLSSTGVVTNGGSPVVTVLGTTLETPPAQPIGGGVNSTLMVTLPGGLLTPGSSIDVQLLLGVNQAGSFRFFISQEALP